MTETPHNVDATEVAKFDALAARWWDPDGEFRPLHEINPLRLDWIRQFVELNGANVLDIGCGGGILAESMAEAGALVTGMDMAGSPLSVARLHAMEAGVQVEYLESTAEALAAEAEEAIKQSVNAGPDGRIIACGTGATGAIDKLQRAGHSTHGLASKSWDEFSGPYAEPIDLVITVCDNAAGESCPIWNGSPITVHWGIPDPAAVTESDEATREAFGLAYERLKRRISALVELDPDEISEDALAEIHQRALQEPEAVTAEG